MLAGLRDKGADAAVGAVMRETEPLPASLPLIEAYARMRSRSAKAAAVVDGRGAVTGVLTLENIGEMMMVENAKPGWRFSRRG
jgi:CBS domain containing-hemolysin-like protein